MNAPAEHAAATRAVTEPVLLRTDEGGVARLTLNRPRQLNAISSEMLDALQAELDTIAADRTVRAVVVDGESDERVFAASAERLIREQGIQTLFGCWTSASRRAVRDVVESHDRLLIYPMQFEGMEQSPNIVYTGAAPNQQILPAVRWAFGFLRHRKFFLVGYNSVFSWAVHALIRDEVAALGGEVVGDEYLTGDDASAFLMAIRGTSRSPVRRPRLPGGGLSQNQMCVFSQRQLGRFDLLLKPPTLLLRLVSPE